MDRAVFVGVDVSKKTLDVCLWSSGAVLCQFAVANRPLGFEQLVRRAESVAEGEDLCFCMESTGGYELDVASFLCERGFFVRVENPCKIKFFARAKGFRNKTDRVDARAIAQYASLLEGRRWYLADPVRREISQLCRHRTRLLEEMVRVANFLEHRSHRPALEVRQNETLLQVLELQISEVEDRIGELIRSHQRMHLEVKTLTGLGGVGFAFAVTLLSELGDVSDYGSGQSYAAAAAGHPCRRESGQTKGRSVMSKAGNKHIRAAGYWPAVRACENNPAVAALAQRLKDRGLLGLQIVCACLRKLVMQCYGLLKALDKGKTLFYDNPNHKEEAKEQKRSKTGPPFKFRKASIRIKCEAVTKPEKQQAASLTRSNTKKAQVREIPKRRVKTTLAS